MKHQRVKILFTGRYEPDYNRTIVILSGLRNIGIEVIEFPFVKRTIQVREKLKAYDQDVDFVFLPSFTHMDVHYVKKYTTKPLIFDPLISKYMSKVFDYHQIFPYSPRALKNYLKDYIMMRLADVVITDTQQHLKYYRDVIKIKESKMDTIPVGVDIQKFYPISNKVNNLKFKAGFYGSFAPLHGIDVIVEAALFLQNDTDIVFEIIGNGYTEKKIAHKIREYSLQNINMDNRVDYENLNKKINSFDICLGIFGDGIKTQVVVPNKVYHYAACGKCIITRDTPAIREVFTDQHDIILTDGTAEDLALKIRLLKEDKALREKIAKNAYQLMLNHYNQDIIAQKLIDVYYTRFGSKTNTDMAT